MARSGIFFFENLKLVAVQRLIKYCLLSTVMDQTANVRRIGVGMSQQYAKGNLSVVYYYTRCSIAHALSRRRRGG